MLNKEHESRYHGDVDNALVNPNKHYQIVHGNVE